MYGPNEDGPKANDPGQAGAGRSEPQVSQPVHTHALGVLDPLRRRTTPAPNYLVESRMRLTAHVRFGERDGENRPGVIQARRPCPYSTRARQSTGPYRWLCR